MSSYRLRKLDHVFVGPDKSDIDLSDDVLEELCSDDFFDEPSNEPLKTYNHANIDQYIAQNQNKSTVKKTFYNIKQLKLFTEGNGDTRPIESIPKSELCDILCTYFIHLKKSDGSNYEPSTIRGMMGSFERYLKSKNYGCSIISDPEFAKLTSVLKTKQKILKSEGMGNLPRRAESLSDQHINKLWECNQLGPNNPESILNTLWWNNTTHFGIRSVKPHVDMKWGDVTLHCDSDGNEFLQFQERQSVTCQGDNPVSVRDVHPEAWATNDARCPVALYKLYATLRPSDYSTSNSPFYLATNTKIPSNKFPWFKRQPVGINKLGSLMKRMSTSAGFEQKRFTNHSARKFLVQKLSEQNIPPTQIMQISGHRNIQSVNNYSHISMSQHRSISGILSGRVDPKQHDSTNTSINLASSHSVTCVSKNENVGLSSIFSGPIYGGNITINFGNSSREPEGAKHRKLSVENDHAL